MNIINYYFILINVISIVCFFADKYASKGRTKRISENLLYSLAIVGGGAGGIIAIPLFNHKSRKFSFLLVYVTLTFASYTMHRYIASLFS